jgi:hypothetical protein
VVPVRQALAREGTTHLLGTRGLHRTVCFPKAQARRLER